MQAVEMNSNSTLPTGTLLRNGTYRIEKQLASGGFGNTYVGYNMELEETVAIKEFFMKGVTERDIILMGINITPMLVQ